MEEESLNKKLTENEEKNIEESYNEELPTIFELNAHDNFHSLIQPAISHLLKVWEFVALRHKNSVHETLIAKDAKTSN